MSFEFFSLNAIVNQKADDFYESIGFLDGWVALVIDATDGKVDYWFNYASAHTFLDKARFYKNNPRITSETRVCQQFES